MQDKNRLGVISADTILEGEIRNCAVLEVYGAVHGTVKADRLVVHRGGRVYGDVVTRTADIHGEIQGNIGVKDLCHIFASGHAAGDVRYGRLAVDDGAVLSADVRNVPPEIGGDMEISVKQGDAAKVTVDDLTAFDPDDDAKDLRFTVSQPTNGHVAFAEQPKTPITSFTQADLQGGRIVFSHDGTPAPTASFAVVVADAQGATSGAAKTVNVAVTQA